MKKFKVGIIGFGIVGKRRKYYIDRHENLEVKAVCDVRFIEKNFKKGKGRIYSNYDQIEKLSKKNNEFGKLD